MRGAICDDIVVERVSFDADGGAFEADVKVVLEVGVGGGGEDGGWPLGMNEWDSVEGSMADLETCG